MSRPAVSPWCARMVGAAVLALPAAQRQRYALEFLAELHEMTRPQQFQHSIGVLTHAWALRSALRSSASTTAQEATMINSSRRPWSCRLGRHRWDQRENPETRDVYEICLRCNAYRDRQGPYPGAGAAGMIGSGGV